MVCQDITLASSTHLRREKGEEVINVCYMVWQDITLASSTHPRRAKGKGE